MTRLQRAVRALIKTHGGVRAAARATGLDAGYLSRLRNGSQKNPSEAVLLILGITRRVTYHAIEGSPGSVA
jgi:hypothetical protein